MTPILQTVASFRLYSCQETIELLVVPPPTVVLVAPRNSPIEFNVNESHDFYWPATPVIKSNWQCEFFKLRRLTPDPRLPFEPPRYVPDRDRSPLSDRAYSPASPPPYNDDAEDSLEGFSFKAEND